MLRWYPPFFFLPSVRPSFLHGPSIKKNDVSSPSCNNDAISYWKYSCCRNWIGERKKVRSGQWEPAAARRHPHKDVGTKGREKKKPRETTKKIPSLSSFLHPMQLGFLVRWIRVLLRTTRMLKTRSDIQKEKPNKTQKKKKKKKKNKPKKKKKKTTNSYHGMSETKLARRTQFLPRRTKTKGGKKNAVHEMKKNKNKKRKQRSSRGSRRGAPGVQGPLGGFKALC